MIQVKSGRIYAIKLICCLLFKCKLQQSNDLGCGRELIFLPSFTQNFVVSVRRSFLFLWVLGKGCIISLPEPKAHS